MKKPYIVITNQIDLPSDQDEFKEVLSNYYISKKAKDNTFIIITEETQPMEIYNLIVPKLSFDPGVLIIELTFFYGHFIDESVFSWLEEQFPDYTWVQ